MATKAFFANRRSAISILVLRRDAGAAGAAADRGRLSDLCRAQGAGARSRCARARTWSGRSACCSRSPTRIKMLMKETIIPTGSNRLLFLLAPMITFGLAMIAWAVIPVNDGWAIANINVGILYLFAISSLGVYGIIIAGWASNSKYAFLGRAAQCGADGVLRSLHGLRHRLRAAVRRQPEPDTTSCWRSRPSGSAFRCSRCSSSSSSRRWRRPTARRSICRKARARSSPASSSNTASMSFALFFLGEYANMILMSGDDHASCSWAAGWRRSPFEPFTWCPGRSGSS